MTADCIGSVDEAAVIAGAETSIADLEEPPPATSWTPVDLVTEWDEPGDPPPTMLSRDDGASLIYSGCVHWFQGEPESLKTWAALHAVEQVVTCGRRALIIDYEGTAAALIDRLKALGVSRDAAGLVTYVRPTEPVMVRGDRCTAAAVDFAALVAGGFDLVVIDGVTEAMTIEALDLNSNQDAAAFLRRIPRMFAAAGAAVICIDHVTKSRETRGRNAIGAQHKLAGADVAYGFVLTNPLVRRADRPGLAAMVVQKDRFGHVRAVARPDGRVGVVVAHSETDGGVGLSIKQPRGDSFDDVELRLLEMIEAQNPATKRDLRNVKGNSHAIDTIAADLQQRQLVLVEANGNRRDHFLTEEGRAHLAMLHKQAEFGDEDR